ncbi:MAG: c-type cytochrome, partial [Gemmataceae bacterium]|nr:c-type cytochrome [Gemmataceae bacterium]
VSTAASPFVAKGRIYFASAGKTFVVAPGFEVNLYAADPLLAKPIQMNFDPQGRLWVASSEVYPQIQPGQVADDKIIVLEDADGDGRAEKTTVFADGLLIPTGVEPGDGGAYVANSTELVHLSASKPGRKADRKRILLSGFGTEDTHHILHTFRWGPDCNLYFNQSIYIHSHVETPHGVKRLNAGGIWKFRPETCELDVFARGWVNSWGHAFDRWGQSLVTDGAGGEGINHAIPGSYFPTAIGPHAQRIMHGLNPGSPKYCGLEIVSGRHFPDDWQGDCITNDFRGHRVCRFKLQDDGSTFASREQVEVIKSSHPAFRPIDVKMGPDGALYVADWYNPIIQHGEVDFRDPRRDKTHGRIWRVTAKGRPLVASPRLVNATIPELLEALKAPEQWTRQQAKRVLKERGKDEVLPALEKWYRTAVGPRNLDRDQHRLEVLWVADSFGCFSIDSADGPQWVIDLWSELRSSEAPRIRAVAARVYGQKWGSSDNLPNSQLNDPHPRVRLEAVRAMARNRDSSAASQALTLLDHPMDRTLDYALWLTVRELEPYWMPAFKEGKLAFGGDPKKLAFALDAVGSKDAVKPVVDLLASGEVPEENVHGLYLLLARIGGPAELRQVIKHADRDSVTAPQRNELFRAVEDAVRTRKVAAPPKIEGDLYFRIDQINTHPDTADRPASRAACRLTGLWKVEGTRPTVQNIAKSTKDIDPLDRAAAMEGVAGFNDDKAKAFLASLAGPETKPDTRRMAIVALAGIDTPAAAREAAEFLSTAAPSPELADVFSAFVNRKGGAALLAKSLASRKLHPDVAKIGLRAVKGSTAADAAPLGDALAKAGGLGAARKEPNAEEVKGFVADVLKSGDPVRGEAVFRRKELQCMACHGVGGSGGQVGPDLTGIGASAPPDYLVESLLIPNKAVKEGFHAVRVVTADDKVHLGIKVREGNGVLVLRTNEDKEVTVPTKDVIERGEARSIMPDGLTDSLTRQEFVDLVRFLSELGKVGPYAPNKARLVRRWQLIEPTRENMDLARRTRLTATAEPNNPFAWAPAYSVVSGDLPLAELPKLVVWNDTAPVSVVRFQLDATTPGAAKVRFNSTAGLTLYLGATPVDVKPETVLDLKPGVQTLTVVIDRSERTDDLRVELDDVPNSPARVSVVGGK